MAFATEAAVSLQHGNAEVQWTALTDIARMYGDTDDNAAGALTRPDIAPPVAVGRA